MRTVGILINHPNLDVLMMPVIAELTTRGIRTEVQVAECGLGDRLDAAGIPYWRDNGFLKLLLESEGERLFLNGADLVPAHRLGMLLDDVCRRNGIPSLTLEHAPFAMDCDTRFPEDWLFAADRMAVVGAEDYRRYRELGVAEDRLVITGCPQFDGLPALRSEREARVDASGSDAGDVIIFGQGHTFAGPEGAAGIGAVAWTAVLSDIYRQLATNFPTARICVKPHPAEPFHKTDDLYHRAIATDLADRVEILTPRTANDELFRRCRCALTFSASVMLEATLAGVPCVIFDHAGRGAEWLDDVGAAGIVVVPGRPQDFATGLANALPALARRKGPPVPLPDGFVAKYLHRFDGGSAARVVDLIEEMLGDSAGRADVATTRAAVPVQ